MFLYCYRRLKSILSYYNRCHFILFHSISSCHFISHYVTPYSILFFCPLLSSPVLNYSVLFSTVQYWTVLFHINHFTLFYITLNSLWFNPTIFKSMASSYDLFHKKNIKSNCKVNKTFSYSWWRVMKLRSRSVRTKKKE